MADGLTLAEVEWEAIFLVDWNSGQHSLSTLPTQMAYQNHLGNFIKNIFTRPHLRIGVKTSVFLRVL